MVEDTDERRDGKRRWKDRAADEKTNTGKNESLVGRERALGKVATGLGYEECDSVRREVPKTTINTRTG